ncbi:MAG TPA: hypothetical protein VLE22_14290 [Bryobacteraceae bacterium]|nr:hypothetical protein [Bryobacteraceae bacterium]
MHEFIARHEEKVIGTLSGFDRLVFRGTLRSISHRQGMEDYLWANQVLLKEFGPHVERVSRRLKEASLAEAEALGRPVKYLTSSQVSKEEMARGIVAKEGIRDGLVCVLTCVEPCWSFEIHRNRENKKLELEPRYRKCLFLYHYWMHPVLGFMNARIQTWFPFPVQICLNGREWLARQMETAGVEYARQDNCFPWIADWAKAQRLMDRQLRVNWPKLLDGVARQLNPAHREIFKKHPVAYYWSTYQSEWAIDIVFREAAELRRLYPRLVHHGMTTFASPDVMRYLGKRIPLGGDVPRRFSGDVVSDWKRRQEGVRIKHSVNGNSLKLYDKAFTVLGSVLRAEATIHNGDDFRVYRPKEGDPEGKLAWRQMRRGIADLHRRAEVSRKAAERYLDAFASVDEDTTLEELIRRLGQSRQWRGRRVRALRPFADDSALVAAVSRGEFAITGFRNRDLQAIFFPRAANSPEEARRRSAWVGRKLRLLRAHGLITKVTGTHRYQLTPTGRKAVTAILTALRSTVRQLTPMAA